MDAMTTANRTQTFPFDELVFCPDDVDLSRSPMAGQIDAETFVLGAFNPGLGKLPNGNLLMMVRIADRLTSVHIS